MTSTENTCESTFGMLQQNASWLANEIFPAVKNSVEKNALPVALVLGAIGAGATALKAGKDTAKAMYKLDASSAAWNATKTAVATASAVTLAISANHTAELMGHANDSWSKTKEVAKKFWDNPKETAQSGFSQAQAQAERLRDTVRSYFTSSEG